jgi:hypothetical protein
MKTKFFFLVVLFALLMHKDLCANHDVVFHDSALDLEDISFFNDPITFTPTGCRCFFRHRLNHPRYVSDFLPHSFSHVIEFLQYSKRTSQDVFFVQAVFDIFTNKIDSVVCVNPDECIHLFQQLPDLLASYFVSSQREYMKRILTYALITQSVDFYTRPEGVINELVNVLGDQQELQRAVMVFVKSILSKVMWRHNDDIVAWKSFVNLWQALSELRNAHIIEHSEETIEDLSSLQWTLVHRFVYFIDLFGSELSAGFYQEARNDLDMNVLSLINADECESDMLTKREVLEQALFVGDVKAQAREYYGIVSEDIVSIR